MAQGIGVLSEQLGRHTRCGEMTSVLRQPDDIAMEAFLKNVSWSRLVAAVLLTARNRQSRPRHLRNTTGLEGGSVLMGAGVA